MKIQYDGLAYYVVLCLYAIFLLFVVIVSTGIPGGVRFFSTKSYSMSPVMREGNLIVTLELPFYNPGDIITYYAKQNGREEIITHRIVRIGGNVYVTKGDANAAQDEGIVVPRLVIGKVIGIVPGLGYIVDFTKSALGVIMVIIIPSLLFVIMEVIKLRNLL